MSVSTKLNKRQLYNVTEGKGRTRGSFTIKHQLWIWAALWFSGKLNVLTQTHRHTHAHIHTKQTQTHTQRDYLLHIYAIDFEVGVNKSRPSQKLLPIHSPNKDKESPKNKRPTKFLATHFCWNKLRVEYISDNGCWKVIALVFLLHDLVYTAVAWPWPEV